MTPSFCAVCIDNRPTRREPLGRDDALVWVCDACATEPVVPVEVVAGVVFVPDLHALSYTERSRARRAELVRLGLCVNGEQHERPRAGQRLCAACLARSKQREQTRVRRTSGNRPGRRRRTA